MKATSANGIKATVLIRPPKTIQVAIAMTTGSIGRTLSAWPMAPGASTIDRMSLPSWSSPYFVKSIPVVWSTGDGGSLGLCLLLNHPTA